MEQRRDSGSIQCPFLPSLMKSKDLPTWGRCVDVGLQEPWAAKPGGLTMPLPISLSTRGLEAYGFYFPSFLKKKEDA